MSIYIFCKAKHSGKTTDLKTFCESNNGVTGILMPDINEERHFYNIQKKEYFIAEINNQNEEPFFSIGKYNFSKQAFKKANLILENLINTNPQLLIIDEIGKLEINKYGFYTSIKKIIQHSTTTLNKTIIIIVVRDIYLHEVISFFEIKNYILLNTLMDIKKY